MSGGDVLRVMPVHTGDDTFNPWLTLVPVIVTVSGWPYMPTPDTAPRPFASGGPAPSPASAVLTVVAAPTANDALPSNPLSLLRAAFTCTTLGAAAVVAHW